MPELMMPRALVLLALLAALLVPLAEAAACDEICYTTELSGFSAGGFTCTCSGSGASQSGSGGCSCGSCYSKQSDGTVIGFAVSSDGTCSFGVNCGDCDYQSASGTASTSTSGSTGSSTNTDGSTASSASASARSTEMGGSTGSTSSSSSTSATNSSSSFKTWQIALVICSVVLVFGLVCTSILACKAKRRLEENDDALDVQAAYIPHEPTSGYYGSEYRVVVVPTTQ